MFLHWYASPFVDPAFTIKPIIELSHFICVYITLFVQSQSIINIEIILLAVDKMTHMVGSYPPKLELQSYTTPSEEAPSGMLARGIYTVHSLFTDDDKNEYLKWEWSFEISKDWKDWNR